MNTKPLLDLEQAAPLILCQEHKCKSLKSIKFLVHFLVFCFVLLAIMPWILHIPLLLNVQGVTFRPSTNNISNRNISDSQVGGRKGKSVRNHIIWVKKLCGQTKSCVKNFQAQKKFGPRKFWVKKNTPYLSLQIK